MEKSDGLCWETMVDILTRNLQKANQSAAQLSATFNH
jgi:hypothetical protein